MSINFKTKFLMLLILISSASCTMEKRQHSSGYHIEWKGNDFAKIKNHLKIKSDSIELIQESQFDDIQYIASTVNEIDLQTSSDINTITSIARTIRTSRKKINHNKSDPCDLVIFKDGSEKEVNIIEVGASEIKYKRCNDQNSPIYSVLKAKVFSTKYPNGEKDFFNYNNDQAEKSSEGKSQLVALLLCIF